MIPSRLNAKSARLAATFAIACIMIGGSIVWASLDEPCAADACRSSFSEVRKLVMDPVPSGAPPDDPRVAAEYGPYLRGEFPRYHVTLGAFVEGIGRAAKKSVDDRADSYERHVHLLHMMGICFSGEWRITQPSEYTGYFAEGSRGLFIGRASTSTEKTKWKLKRSFGFAGKIFPTLDENERVETANFVVIDNLGGNKKLYYHSAPMTNEPAAGFDFTPVKSLAIFFGFNSADSKIFMRPLNPIAEAGLAEAEVARTPRWMRLRFAKDMPEIEASDFREELDLKNYPNGLRLDLDVSDTSKDPKEEGEWRLLGQIELRESQVSYGCDRMLRFKHSKIKK